MAQVSRAERFARWFGAGDDWERVPEPGRARFDARVAILFALCAMATLELYRSLGLAAPLDRPVWQQHALLLAGIVPLFWRRRFPLTVAVLGQLHFFTVGVTMPQVAYLLVVQLLCFFGLYSGVAWARDRRALLVVLGAVLIYMIGWLAWDFALGNSIAQMTAEAAGRGAAGLVSPPVAWVLLTVFNNVVFFLGAVLLGQNSWRSARRSAIVAEQRNTIARQAHELRDRAVVQERLRIARELHDVVAHHVSVMGVQAAAARRVLDRRPDAAAQALSQIEESSRQSVAEMRRLLGTLRAGEDAASEPSDSVAEQGVSREPEPGLARVADLVEQARGPGLAVAYDLVEEPAGAAETVPAPMGLSVYRIVQEALSNVRRHSTAARVGVVVRVIAAPGRGTRGYVEAEVVDNGRPRAGTSGTGMGLLGMRERASSHGGLVEAGPRLSGGYRVRARFPLDQALDQAFDQAIDQTIDQTGEQA